MHHLFETARPSFQYKNTASQKVLDIVKFYWKKKQDGPLVTMDAGANVHLLYRKNQSMQKQQLSKLLSNFTLLSSL